MVIDINRLNGTPNPVGNGRTANAQAADKTSAASAAVNPEKTTAAASGESVQLSAQAQSLQDISNKVRDLPIVNSERVAQLKQAIADGSYQIDDHRVAGKLLNFESQR
jgi:negative regulator of flagellin synthesis FlgM